MTGERGLTGAIGQTGATGAIGQTGSKGDRGETGSQGIQGIPGVVGATGNQGLQGIPGAVGARGDIGARGIQGVPGATGAQGNSGATGATGAIGATGSTGATGAIGATGQTGAKGDRGEVGVNWRGTWTPTTAYIPRDFVIHNGSSYIAIAANTNSVPATSPSWTFLVAQGTSGVPGSPGLQGSPGTPGIQGAQGAIGLQGPQGAIGLQGIPGGAGRSIQWRNVWSPSTSYLVSDAISYNGSSYVAVAANTNNLPGVSTNWMLLAQQGASAPGPKCSVMTIPLTYNGTNLIQQYLGFHSRQILGITGTCHMSGPSHSWVAPPGGYANGVPPIAGVPSQHVQTANSSHYSFAAGSSAVQIIIKEGAFFLGQQMTFKIMVWWE